MRRALTAAVLAAPVAFVAACGNAPAPAPSAPAAAPSTPAAATTTPPAAPTFTMKGAYDLFILSGSPLADGTPCKGEATDSDLVGGSPVRVFDAQGKLLATGKLGVGTFSANPQGRFCGFPLTVSNVPDGLLEYSVEIGQRGPRKVSSGEAHSWVFMYSGF